MIAARILQERKRRGWSRKQLASAVNVHWGAVQRWESGKFEPGASMLCKLADVFDCTTDYLLGRTEERLLLRKNAS